MQFAFASLGTCLSVSKLELQNRKDKFDFGTNRRFLMLAPLDLCLKTGRVIFTLTGTTIDFVPDFLSGRIFLSGFGTLFCSKISAVTVDLFFLSGEKVGSNTDIMHIGSSYLYCVDKSCFQNPHRCVLYTQNTRHFPSSQNVLPDHALFSDSSLKRVPQ